MAARRTPGRRTPRRAPAARSGRGRRARTRARGAPRRPGRSAAGQVVQPVLGGHPAGGAVAGRPAAAQPVVGADVRVEPAVAVGRGDPLVPAPVEQRVDERVHVPVRLEHPLAGVRHVDARRRRACSRTCAGLRRSVRLAPGRVAQHEGVALAAAPPPSASVGRPRPGGVGDELLGARRGRSGSPSRSQLEAQQGRRRLGVHRADEPHRGRRAPASCCRWRGLERGLAPRRAGARGRAATRRGRRAGARHRATSVVGGRCRRRSAAKSKRSPVGGAGTSSTRDAVCRRPALRRRRASTRRGGAGGPPRRPRPARPATPAATRGAPASAADHQTQRGDRTWPRAGAAASTTSARGPTRQPPSAERARRAARRAGGVDGERRDVSGDHGASSVGGRSVTAGTPGRTAPLTWQDRRDDARRPPGRTGTVRGGRRGILGFGKGRTGQAVKDVRSARSSRRRTARATRACSATRRPGWSRTSSTSASTARAPFDSGRRRSPTTALAKNGATSRRPSTRRRSHLKLAAAGGFVTSVGGFITLPVALPANVLGFYLLATRMTAAVASLRGYDITRRADPHGRPAHPRRRRRRRPARARPAWSSPGGTPHQPRRPAAARPGAHGRQQGRRLPAARDRRARRSAGSAGNVPIVGGVVGAGLDGWLLTRSPTTPTRVPAPPRRPRGPPPGRGRPRGNGIARRTSFVVRTGAQMLRGRAQEDPCQGPPARDRSSPSPRDPLAVAGGPSLGRARPGHAAGMVRAVAAGEYSGSPRGAWP